MGPGLHFGPYVRTALAALLATLVVWAFPAVVGLAFLTNTFHSLLAAGLVLMLVAFPLYLLLLGFVLYKLHLPIPREPKYAAACIFVLFIAGIVFPQTYLRDQYGFATPTSSYIYRYDSCVLESGVSMPSADSTKYSCTDKNGNNLPRP
jgi:hypothetical protein